MLSASLNKTFNCFPSETLVFSDAPVVIIYRKMWDRNSSSRFTTRTCLRCSPRNRNRRLWTTWRKRTWVCANSSNPNPLKCAEHSYSYCKRRNLSQPTCQPYRELLKRETLLKRERMWFISSLFGSFPSEFCFIKCHMSNIVRV